MTITNLADLRREWESDVKRYRQRLTEAEVRLGALDHIESVLRAGQSWKTHACPDPGQEVDDAPTPATEFYRTMGWLQAEREQVLGVLRADPLLNHSLGSITNALPHLAIAEIIRALKAAEDAGEVTVFHGIFDGNSPGADLYRIKQASPDEPAERSDTSGAQSSAAATETGHSDRSVPFQPGAGAKRVAAGSNPVEQREAPRPLGGGDSRTGGSIPPTGAEVMKRVLPRFTIENPITQYPTET